MRNRSTIPIALTAAALLSLTALSPALAQKGPGDPEPPITLRLLVQDAPGRQSEPAALDLARLAEPRPETARLRRRIASQLAALVVQAAD